MVAETAEGEKMNKAIKLILIIAGIACGLGLVFGIVGQENLSR